MKMWNFVISVVLATGMIMASQGQNATENANTSSGVNVTDAGTSNSAVNETSTGDATPANVTESSTSVNETNDITSSLNNNNNTDDSSSASLNTNSTESAENETNTTIPIEDATSHNITESTTPDNETSTNNNTSATVDTAPNPESGSAPNSTIPSNATESQASPTDNETSTNETTSANEHVTNATEMSSEAVNNTESIIPANVTDENVTSSANMSSGAVNNTESIIPANVTDENVTSSANMSSGAVNNTESIIPANVTDENVINSTNMSSGTVNNTESIIPANLTGSSNTTNQTNSTDFVPPTANLTNANMTGSDQNETVIEIKNSDNATENTTSTISPVDMETTTSSSYCNFPDDLPGEWWSTIWGEVSINVTAFKTGNASESLSLNFDCYKNNGKDDKYIIRQLDVKSEDDKALYTCISFVRHNRDNFLIEILTERNSNRSDMAPIVEKGHNDEVNFDEICNAGKEIIEGDLLRKGQEIQGALGCSQLLRGMFNVTYTGATLAKCPDGAKMNSCDEVKTLKYNYTTCNGVEGFSGENKYICVSGGFDQVTTFRDSPEVNDFTPFACLTINQTDGHDTLAVTFRGHGCGGRWAEESSSTSKVTYTLDKEDKCPETSEDDAVTVSQNFVFTAILAVASWIVSRSLC